MSVGRTSHGIARSRISFKQVDNHNEAFPGSCCRHRRCRPRSKTLAFSPCCPVVMPIEPCTGQVLLYHNCHGMCNVVCACMPCMTCHTRTRPPTWPLSQFDRNRRFLKQTNMVVELACVMRARTYGPYERTLEARTFLSLSSLHCFPSLTSLTPI